LPWQDTALVFKGNEQRLGLQFVRNDSEDNYIGLDHPDPLRNLHNRLEIKATYLPSEF